LQANRFPPQQHRLAERGRRRFERCTGCFAEASRVTDNTTKTGKADRAAKTLESIQVRIDRLVTTHLYGRISELDFEPHYRDLVAEKENEQLRLTTDPRPAMHLQAQKLAKKGELSREELRQLVLLAVERVEAPITLEGVSIRPGKKTPRKLARITLTLPTSDGEAEFWSPIYSQNFDGCDFLQEAGIEFPIGGSLASSVACGMTSSRSWKCRRGIWTTRRARPHVQ